MGTSWNTILNYNLVRFGVCMIKLRHERLLILRCILPPKKAELPPEKKLTPHHLENLKHPDKKLKLLGISKPMRNLKLLEKYQPSPRLPPNKSQSTRKRKNITPRKSFNHLKIASTIMKKLHTPHLKNSQFLKKT